MRVIVVRDRATRDMIVEHSVTGARRYIAQTTNGEGPWNPVKPMQVSAEEVAATVVPPYLGAPVLSAGAVLVICVDLNVVAAFDQYLDRIGVIPGASVYPFVWNILLAARNEGYGGVLTTMAVAEEPRLKELLGIPDDYAIAAVLPIGKPVKQFTKLTRKSVAEPPPASGSTASRSAPSGRCWTCRRSGRLPRGRWRSSAPTDPGSAVIVSAAAFSSSRSIRFVPGIGAMWSLCANSHASAI